MKSDESLKAVIPGSKAVILGSTRDPATAREQAPDWIAGQARNDIQGAPNGTQGARDDIQGACNDTREPVIPGLTRDPATLPEPPRDWIAGQARNDIQGDRND